ncbi:helix-turn-helix transcriptional regulator [Mangrovibrevibacter kandeliae]|uniref:helix-turn-helix transcriptional regulator n=1 Tax=Mangrovibrevibacter kandeliae TaxID=2968473 RepID=UPI00211898FD|nr:helix-turn-helix transcriptional regulator [Aurantimonas sp. CSK15Z-1]MCQ8782313.1 helix-turn-helix transcriptional regulator [Aurantimonas sp. CSK15Z-1]
MKLPPERRRQLGAFLRRHREALEDRVNPSGRRRTPGLRREDVAERAGLSASWYTWAEQGRDVALSDAALARLSDALRLSPPERRYLFELAQRRDPSPPSLGLRYELPAELGTLVGAIALPAYVMDPLWRARVWNTPAGVLFAPWLGSGEACLLRFVLLDPRAQDFIVDWEDRARRLVAEFRSDIAGSADPAIDALASDLNAVSALFRQAWDRQLVLDREGGLRRFRGPDGAISSYRQATLSSPVALGWKVVYLEPLAAEG